MDVVGLRKKGFSSLVYNLGFPALSTFFFFKIKNLFEIFSVQSFFFSYQRSDRVNGEFCPTEGNLCSGLY